MHRTDLINLQLDQAPLKTMERAFPTESDLVTLSKKCAKLNSFKANVLRSARFQQIAWEKKDEKWSGGVKAGRT